MNVGLKIMKGTVKFFNQEKKFGFIRSSDGTDTFFHSSEWQGECAPSKGVEVEFNLAKGRNGPKARFVSVLKEAEEMEKIIKSLPEPSHNLHHVCELLGLPTPVGYHPDHKELVVENSYRFSKGNAWSSSEYLKEKSEDAKELKKWVLKLSGQITSGQFKTWLACLMKKRWPWSGKPIVGAERLWREFQWYTPFPEKPEEFVGSELF